MGARAVGRDRAPVACLRGGVGRGVFSRAAVSRRGARAEYSTSSGAGPWTCLFRSRTRLMQWIALSGSTVTSPCRLRMRAWSGCPSCTRPVRSLTLDRDFTIYRRSRRKRIPLLSPGGDPCRADARVDCDRRPTPSPSTPAAASIPPRPADAGPRCCRMDLPSPAGTGSQAGGACSLFGTKP